MMGACLLALLLSTLCTLVSTWAHAVDLAAELQPAQAALAAGDYETAFREYHRIAEEKHNPLAQFTVALFFQLGWGRPRDPVTACQWHEKAAAGKIPLAEHSLGDCLLRGVHRPPDPTQAASWFARAAQNGYVLSLCSLGELYVTGKGVPKNPAKGLALCRGAAEQGVVPAMTRMGQFFLQGDAGQPDFDAAFSWFELAARRKSPEAQYYLGRMLRDGLGRPQGPVIARYWFESAAAQGYIPAYFPTAVLYFNAPVDPETHKQPAEDVAKAYLWLSATAKRSQDPGELAETAQMLMRLREIIPDTWLSTLDEKVAKHLAEHAAP